jgi:hypothetical protein
MNTTSRVKPASARLLVLPNQSRPRLNPGSKNARAEKCLLDDTGVGGSRSFAGWPIKRRQINDPLVTLAGN